MSVALAGACSSFSSEHSGIPDASMADTGDSLAREAKAPCTGQMLTDPSALFPGSRIYLYVPMGVPAASYSLPWCPVNGTLSYDLLNPAPGRPICPG